MHPYRNWKCWMLDDPDEPEACMEHYFQEVHKVFFALAKASPLTTGQMSSFYEASRMHWPYFEQGIEKFIVFSALCFCFSCCLLLL